MTNQQLQTMYAELGYTLEIKISERQNLPAVVCTRLSKNKAGKKTILNYYFSTEARRTEFILKFYNEEKARIEKANAAKIERRAQNAAIKAAEHFKVGDMIVNTWGYEQTNVDFFQVIEVGNKTLKVREVSQQIQEGSMYSHGMACNVLPKADQFIGEEFQVRLKVDYNGDVRCCSPKNYYYFRKWDGRPVYNSWYN